MAQELSACVEAAQKGKLPREVVVKKISIYIYQHLQRKYRGDEDTASDIFCMIYPRIARMVAGFEFRGRPFEVYLHMSVKRLTITYFQKKRQAESLNRYSERAWSVDRTETPPEEPTAGPEPIDATVRSYLRLTTHDRIDGEHLRRRMLCLVCKNAFRISREQTARTAALTGVSAQWLEERLESLRGTMSRRTERLDRLSSRRKEYMAWEHLYHEYMVCAADEAERLKYQGRMTRATQRVKALSRAIQRIPLSPTHSEIAKTLAMPKGSVDSGLYYIRSGLAADSIKSRKPG